MSFSKSPQYLLLSLTPAYKLVSCYYAAAVPVAALTNKVGCLCCDLDPVSSLLGLSDLHSPAGAQNTDAGSLLICALTKSLFVHLPRHLFCALVAARGANSTHQAAESSRSAICAAPPYCQQQHDMIELFLACSSCRTARYIRQLTGRCLWPSLCTCTSQPMHL